MKKKKYYVVWVGQKPGVYDTWSTCQSQVIGYPGAKFKSFTSRKDAQEAFERGPSESLLKNRTSGGKVKTSISPILEGEAWAVDAACSGNPGLLEYQGVLIHDRSPLFHVGPLPGGTNNVGEFLAIVHALALAKKKNLSDVPIYTDSRTASLWVQKKKANTTLKKSKRNAEVFDLIRRGERWLEKNKWSNPIIKWPTKKWGEIPADFGRK